MSDLENLDLTCLVFPPDWENLTQVNKVTSRPEGSRQEDESFNRNSLFIYYR